MDEPIKTTGELVPYTHHPDGRRITSVKPTSMWSVNGHVRCVDCNTIFPILTVFIERNESWITSIRCNGQSITLCPWCQKDSQPWFVGRGK